MASPQWELDGYVKIARPIMEALIKTRIPGEARQCLDFIIAKTYGFHKREDSISLSQFCLATGLRKSAVCRAILKLTNMNLIIKKENDNITKYRFNKDFDTWNLLSKKITLSKKIMTVIEKDNASFTKKRHTKEITTKETFTKEKALDFFTDSFKGNKDFVEAWGDWWQHRKEKRQKLTPTTVKSQAKKLEGWGVERAIAAIRNSIDHGYMGIYEAKGGQVVSEKDEKIKRLKEDLRNAETLLKHSGPDRQEHHRRTIAGIEKQLEVLQGK